MAGAVREHMVRGAAKLLSRRGLGATSLGEVLELTGAPRGSVYHHFPGGKQEMLLDAIRFVGASVLTQLTAQEPSSPEDVVRSFAELWRCVLIGSEYTAGCAVVAVTVAADPDFPRLRAAAATVFKDWQGALATLLCDSGIPPERSVRLAAVIVAALEGAVLLSRATRELGPFDAVTAELVELVSGGR